MNHAGWIVLALAACGSGNGGDDGPGDSCPDFTRIAGGTFARTADTLTWTLEVEGIPAELTFDRTGVPDFVLEYNWSVDLDTNRDGTRDWEVAIKHFRTDGPERITGDILGSTQQDLWRITGAAGTIDGDVDATLAGSTFTLSVDVSEDPDLANVTDASQSTWTTFHQFGADPGDRCEDSFQN